MKIAVIGANGKMGRLLIEEGLNREMDMTAIVRSENKSSAKNVILKNLFDLTKEDLKGFDVIITAFGVWKPEEFHLHITSLKHLSDLLEGENARLLVVGGAGNLYIDKIKKIRAIDAPDFPEEFKPLAISEVNGLEELKKSKNVKWTYVSPAMDFRYDGKRTGEYILSDDTFTLNEKGESVLSYADYAIAMLDEAISGNHIKEAISIVGK